MLLGVGGATAVGVVVATGVADARRVAAGEGVSGAAVGAGEGVTPVARQAVWAPRASSPVRKRRRLMRVWR